MIRYGRLKRQVKRIFGALSPAGTISPLSKNSELRYFNFLPFVNMLVKKVKG